MALSALLVLAAPPPGATVRAEVDTQKLGVEDLCALTLTIEGRDVRLEEEVAAPPLSNLRIVGGPGLQTRMSIVNGAMTQARIYSWTLKPSSPGKAEVGAFRVKLSDGERSTTPVTLEVVPGRIRTQERARPRAGVDPFGEDPFESFFGRRPQRREAKVFVEATPARTRLHVGEPLRLTYHLYTQVGVTDLQFAEAPQYPGFWSEELPRSQQPPSGEAVSVGGEPYRRFPVLEKLLFPTRAGSLTIPAARMRIGLAPEGFFDRGDTNVERPTKPVTITVSPIPEAPGFSGAVGRFRASASVDRASVPLGEAVTLRFRVEGSGNLKWIEKAPDLALPGAKVYPPQVKSDLKPSASGIDGWKTWEFVVVPETAGPIEIPRLAFSYFDPQQGKLAVTDSAPIVLQVASQGGRAGTLAVAARAGAASAGRLSLRSDLDSTRPLLPAIGARTQLLGVSGLVAAHALLWVWPHVRWPGRKRRRPAPRGGQKAALAELRRAERGGLRKEQAAALIEQALHDAFGNLDNADPADEALRAARQVLDEAQFLRYAPQLGDYSEKIRDTASRAADVVRRWA